MAKREIRTPGGVVTYYLDDREVTHKVFHGDWHVKPPNYEKGECPTVKPDLGDFTSERCQITGKRGRYMPQLAKFRGDKRAVFEHVNDASAAAKRRGMNVEKA